MLFNHFQNLFNGICSITCPYYFTAIFKKTIFKFYEVFIQFIDYLIFLKTSSASGQIKVFIQTHTPFNSGIIFRHIEGNGLSVGYIKTLFFRLL